MNDIAVNHENDRNMQSEEFNNKKNLKKRKKSIGIRTGIATIIVATISAVARIISSLIETNTAIKLKEMDIPVVEIVKESFFCNEARQIERAGISYIEYELISEPVISGYHVRPYPYLLYEEKGEKVVIPLIHWFTEEEYTADMEGICVLLKEDSLERITDIADACTVDVILIIAYIDGKDGTDTRKCFILNNGKMQEAEDDKVIQVLKAYESGEKVIDMSGWPRNKEQTRMLLNIN